MPADDDWLGPEEVAVAQKLRFAKRRADWRLGRWAAKRALAACGRPLPGDTQILAAPDGAPEVVFAGEPLPWSISITHSHGVAACAVALDGDEGMCVGCDLERIEPRSEAFIGDWLTADEQTLVRQAPIADQALWVTLIWSAKESALKSLRSGLRRDTRTVEVSVRRQRTTSWQPLSVADRQAEQILHGWWSVQGGHVLTVSATERSEPPRVLVAGDLPQ